MKLRYIALVLLSTASLSSWGWGQKGHDTVAAIAEKHLTEASADSLASILDGMSAVYWANWLDNASHTPDYSYTKTWHYKNIDADQTYESMPLNEKGDVVTAAREQIAILSSPRSAKAQKALALKILIHVIGDMHQPMHMGRKTDLGGNKHQLQYFGQGKNLHSIWDSNLLNSAHAWTYTEWVDQIDRLSEAQAQAEMSGNIDDWAKQTWGIAKRVYDYFPVGCKVSYDQVAAWTPTIEEQLRRGGLRLARVLNTIFDPAFNGSAEEF